MTFGGLELEKDAGKTKTLNALLRGVQAHKSLSPKAIEKAYKTTAMESGVDSLLTALPQMAAEKLLGKEKVRSAIYDKITRPALHADTAAGNIVAKIPVLGGLFKNKEKILVDVKKGIHHDVTRNSLLAPAVKVRNLAEPIALMYVADKASTGLKAMSEERKRRKELEKMNKAHIIKKAANTMLRLNDENEGHTKRANALRLLYKQAELGIAQVPQTFGELEEKLASLINEDLVVLEKAMDLAGGSIKLGELGSSDIKARTPSDMFRAAILGESEDYY